MKSFAAARLLFAAAVFTMAWRSAAINASPFPFKEKQPDGATVELRIQGDEHVHWLEDSKGYSVVHTDEGYFYATRDKSTGGLAPSALKVGQDDPAAAGLQPRTLPTDAYMEEKEAAHERVTQQAIEKSGLPEKAAPSGTVKNLVVPIRFSNHLARSLPSQADMDVLFNAVGGDATRCPTGSVRDVYTENSYGQMTLQSAVLNWVNVPNTESYYANGDSGDSTLWQALKSALNSIDSTVNFKDFDADNDNWVDAIAFLHSGYGAEWGGTDSGGVSYEDRIWSHRWTMSPTWTSAEGVRVAAYHISPALWGTSGSAIGRVGVICHETGHFFGLPDLYDTTKPGSGIGSWCLMANSWGFDNSQLHPPHFSAWSKIFLGWTTATVLENPGNYSINQWALNNQVYRIDHGFPTGEYLLVENRQPVGMETAMPQGGLAVYHVDEAVGYDDEGYPGQSGWPTNGMHYRIALLQADGQYHLEKEANRGDAGDVFRGGGVSSLTANTVPNTSSYRSGNILSTGIELSQISGAGATMSFRYTYGDDLYLSDTGDFSIGGSAGGVFSPASRAYTINNSSSTTARTWTVAAEHASPWLLLNTAGGVLAPNASATVYVSVDQAIAALLPAGSYSDTLVFTNVNTGWSFSVNVQLAASIYWFSMDTNPGWSTQGQWAFGVPTGGGGAHGKPDPTAGHTGANVYGYNLGGDYANSLSPTQYLKTTALNCANYEHVTVRFRRWLGVESPTYDHAYFEVSNDNTNWTTIWQNTAEVADESWQLVSYDISAVADKKSTVYLRWGMGVTDSSWEFCGWNIDDVALVGDYVPDPCPQGPVLSLAGEAVVNVECGTAYADAGASAMDDCDGDISGSISVVNPVDTATTGTYTITYNVSDSDGHAAGQIARTVNVTDATPPQLSITGEAVVLIECGGDYEDAGATASDACEGDVTGNIIASGSVNTGAPGDYPITYNVSDGSGNAATPLIRTVTVADTTAPQLAIGVALEESFECGAQVPAATPVALDGCDGDISAQVQVSGGFDSATPGDYEVVYSLADASGNGAQLTRVVHILDSVAPEVTVLGDNPAIVPCHGFYLDGGYSASDSCEGDLTGLVQISSNLPLVLNPGTYTVTYSVSDGSGNVGTAERTVLVQDDEAPNLLLSGSASLSIDCHGNFIDPGAFASDACAGILDGAVTVEGSVDSAVPGEYTLSYHVQDPSGNAATPVTRVVTVLDVGCPEEGEIVADGEGLGEGIAEGIFEGIAEGTPEGGDEHEAEGFTPTEGEGEGVKEGAVDGEVEGDGEGAALLAHSADPNGDGTIDLTELLRAIQLFNAIGFGCAIDTEDGFAPNAVSFVCHPYSGDYAPQDWMISLSELLRLVQFYNVGQLHPCESGEDGFCAGP